jgi:hypothetical protein
VIKKFVLAAYVCSLALGSFAQKASDKFNLPDITPADFATKVYPIDSSAQAVIIYDGGSAKYVSDNAEWFNINYTYKKRIRLLNKNAFNLATVEIPLWKGDRTEDRIEKLEACTYTLENGSVVKTKLDKESLFKDKASKNYTIQKFTFPNLKEGCIIEYTYSVTSPNSYYLKGWKFQDSYPVLKSEYEVSIPTLFNFISVGNGYYDLKPKTVSNDIENFHLRAQSEGAFSRSEYFTYKATIVYYKWSIDNLTALKKESYTTTLENHISKIDFQLKSMDYPDSPPTPYMGTWNGLVTTLMKDEEFGAGLSDKNNWMEDDLANLIVKKDDLGTAKNIYKYVRDNFSCTDHDAIEMTGSLKKAYLAKKGNVADVNLVLVAMLKKAGISTDPVLLSTRDNGVANEQYPLIGKFNYVIAKAMIGGKEVLLDASQKKLGFGYLPAYCYNGSGRIISENPFLVMLSADSINESKFTSILISNDPDSKKITGTFISNLGPVESYNLRTELASSDKTEYFKKLKAGFNDVEISNESLDSLNNPDENISVVYDFALKFDEDIIYYNPLMGEAYKTNPFTALTRNYPVEMPFKIDELIVLNMEVPTGYTIDELPKSVKLSLNDTEGMFEYIIQSDGKKIQLKCSIQLNKANFEPDDYQTLRDFFTYIVKKESEQFVFKKIK